MLACQRYWLRVRNDTQGSDGQEITKQWSAKRLKAFTCCWQVRRFDVRFIMKADDDAFVNVPALIAELKANCVTPGCRRERMYFGREIRNNVVNISSEPRIQLCIRARR